MVSTITFTFSFLKKSSEKSCLEYIIYQIPSVNRYIIIVGFKKGP